MGLHIRFIGHATIHVHPTAGVVDICRIAAMYKLVVVMRNNRTMLEPYQTAFQPRPTHHEDSAA